MTTWQWKVIQTLCKLVLEMLAHGTANTVPLQEDLDLLKEAVEGTRQ